MFIKTGRSHSFYLGDLNIVSPREEYKVPVGGVGLKWKTGNKIRKGEIVFVWVLSTEVQKWSFGNRKGLIWTK